MCFELLLRFITKHSVVLAVVVMFAIISFQNKWWRVRRFALPSKLPFINASTMIACVLSIKQQLPQAEFVVLSIFGAIIQTGNGKPV